MTLLNFKEDDKIEIVTQPNDSPILFKGCYVGDLLSWVMSHAKAGQLWLTVQAHPNVVAIATLLELSAIVVVEGADIPKETIERAKLEGVILLKTSLSAVETVHYLNQLMGE